MVGRPGAGHPVMGRGGRGLCGQRGHGGAAGRWRRGRPRREAARQGDPWAAEDARGALVAPCDYAHDATFAIKKCDLYRLEGSPPCPGDNRAHQEDGLRYCRAVQLFASHGTEGGSAVSVVSVTWATARKVSRGPGGRDQPHRWRQHVLGLRARAPLVQSPCDPFPRSWRGGGRGRCTHRPRAATPESGVCRY